MKTVSVLLVLLILAVFGAISVLPIAHATTPFAVDGSGNCSTSGTPATTCTITFTTTYANDVIVVAEESTATCSGVACYVAPTSTSVTFLPRVTSLGMLGEYYAVWTSSGSITITCNLSSAHGLGCEAFGVSGANTAHPFDQYCAISSDSNNCVIITTNANDFVYSFGFNEAVGYFTPTISSPGYWNSTDFGYVLVQKTSTFYEGGPSCAEAYCGIGAAECYNTSPCGVVSSTGKFIITWLMFGTTYQFVIGDSIISASSSAVTTTSTSTYTSSTTPPQPYVSGACNTESISTSCTIAFKTTNTNDVIIIVEGADYLLEAPTSNITLASGSTTFAGPRQAPSQTQDYQAEYYGVLTAATSINITCNQVLLSESLGCVAFAISGAKISADEPIFDGSGCSHSFTSTGYTRSCSFSTSYTGDILFGSAFNYNATFPYMGSGSGFIPVIGTGVYATTYYLAAECLGQPSSCKGTTSTGSQTVTYITSFKTCGACSIIGDAVLSVSAIITTTTTTVTSIITSSFTTISGTVYVYSTTSVIGWLMPDSAHFSNSLLLTIFPLMGMVLVVMIPKMFHRKGDVVVYFALGGLFLGSILADMSTNNSPTNAVPFGIIVTIGILLFCWWWNS